MLVLKSTSNDVMSSDVTSTDVTSNNLVLYIFFQSHSFTFLLFTISMFQVGLSNGTTYRQT